MIYSVRVQKEWIEPKRYTNILFLTWKHCTACSPWGIVKDDKEIRKRGGELECSPLWTVEDDKNIRKGSGELACSSLWTIEDDKEIRKRGGELACSPLWTIEDDKKIRKRGGEFAREPSSCSRFIVAVPKRTSIYLHELLLNDILLIFKRKKLKHTKYFLSPLLKIGVVSAIVSRLSTITMLFPRASLKTVYIRVCIMLYLRFRYSGLTPTLSLTTPVR